MKITKIKIKNILGIQELELDGKDYELTGSKGAGKTSVLDAIRYALTNQSPRPLIVRKGETEGEILIETDTGISVSRKPRNGKADYKNIRQNGKTIQSPESFINEIFTPLQLDPISFLEKSDQEQNRIILNLIDYPGTWQRSKNGLGRSRVGWTTVIQFSKS